MNNENIDKYAHRLSVRDGICYENASDIMNDAIKRLKDRNYKSEDLIRSAYKYSRKKLVDNTQKNKYKNKYKKYKKLYKDTINNNKKGGSLAMNSYQIFAKIIITGIPDILSYSLSFRNPGPGYNTRWGDDE